MSNQKLSEEDVVTAITRTFLSAPTAKQRLLTCLMHSSDNRYQPFCTSLTRDTCSSPTSCQYLHFKPVLYPQTDPSYGHCSYLNTCHRTSSCKYLHFELDTSLPYPPFQFITNNPRHPYEAESEEARQIGLIHPSRTLREHGFNQWVRDPGEGEREAQWIDCDLKAFDYSMLGNFDVILADPPWDIHMSLPYGTMSDDDMRAMPVPVLQDEGLIFLWTTGRAMELGRQLLAHWGYTRIDELIWVKVGQTQRLIRTGRTGHHLNHTKEHCLVGAKVRTIPDRDVESKPVTNSAQCYIGSRAAGVPPPLPEWLHQGINADVIVSEVRDTSRKPDELYSIIERLCPGGRKVELFGRKHNVRKGWLTLGNQLKGDHVLDPALKARLEAFRNSQREQQQPQGRTVMAFPTQQ
ncbi:related to IME4 - positive transcription factor for IME2 [Melanopsichium pennsylvanicum]|uniref:mRNA m(6)A methyltransferase n=2 Tax=Melanopsichium pennsylvanicum TaxID=63383 RepID=A0AAJ4XRZ2_9BASI|nr:related to IME4-positive transcription factor for IME2 [Melanopsichium pennsylvanicum 4]SNX87292.1 related to IME4 - positive transcription factor for IME2 [Melanopsichium pennsylvanicum]